MKCRISGHIGTLIDRFIPSRRGSKVSIFIGAEVKGSKVSIFIGAEVPYLGSKVSIFIGAEVPYLGLKSQYWYCIQLYLFGIRNGAKSRHSEAGILVRY